jgi:hypothetical protein
VYAVCSSIIDTIEEAGAPRGDADAVEGVAAPEAAFAFALVFVLVNLISSSSSSSSYATSLSRPPVPADIAVASDDGRHGSRIGRTSW